MKAKNNQANVFPFLPINESIRRMVDHKKDAYFECIASFLKIAVQEIYPAARIFLISSVNFGTTSNKSPTIP